MHHRLKIGRSIEEAFGLEEFEYRSKAKKFVVEGRVFDSLRDACRHYGIDKDVLNARINRYGWSLEEGLGVVQRPGYEKGVAGYVYLITREACGKKYVGITMCTVETRWNQHLEKAACIKRLPLLGIHHAIRQESPAAFTIQRLATASLYGELLELEEKFVRELNCKAPHGYNLTCGGGGTRTKGKPVKVAGLKFPSITAACKHYGKDRRMSTFRLKKGWTIEQVMGLVEAPKDKRCGSRSTAVT